MKVEGQKDGVREEEGQMDEGREVSFFRELSKGGNEGGGGDGGK